MRRGAPRRQLLYLPGVCWLLGFAFRGGAAIGAEAGAEPAHNPMEAGRVYTAWFHEWAIEELFERMSPILQEALESAAALGRVRKQLVELAGDGERQLIDERVTRSKGYDVYLRTERWKRGTVFVTQFAMGEGGLIEGFFVRPSVSQAATTRHLAYETKTPLRLPFDGEWFVVWGGRKIEQNHHAATVDQRFASDVLRVKGGSTFRGDGTKNDDFYAFGLDVLAPGKGVVVAVADDFADNEPGTMDPENALGNHVIIDHGNAEFSFIAHLQQGSLAVERGENVKAGQPLGRCGNSGNSTEPHVHYHLQNTASFGRGEGLPAFFNTYLADGKEVKRGEPIKGQRVEQR